MLGSLGGQSVGNAINDHGDVAGVSSLGWSSPQHAFLSTDEHGFEDLGVLPGLDQSHAFALNNLGWVVGVSYTGYYYSNRATVWSRETGLLDLNWFLAPGADLVLTDAIGVNDAGQILALARHDYDDGYLVRLTLTNLPAPGALALMPCAAIAMGMRRRRHPSVTSA
jgi:probable HAF family extracellular repeat protein